MTHRIAAIVLTFVALLCGLAPALASKVERNLSIFSLSLDRALSFSIYLPDGYADKSQRFPVIYLLHGHGGDGAAWLDLGGLRATADKMISDGRLPPSIIVMPSAQNGWYVDNAAQGGTGRWQTAILDDLSDAIDSRYRTQTTREGRAIAGYSMGGYGALRFALLEPDKFAVAASLSGALFPDVKSATDFPAFQLAFFGAAFGAKFDPRTFNAASPWRNLSADGAEGDAPAIYMAVGDNDIPILKAGNDLFRQALVVAGLPVEYHVVPGSHDWRLWSAQLEPMLAFIGRNLKRSVEVARDAGPVQKAPVTPASAAVAKAADTLVGMKDQAAATAASAQGARPVITRP